MAQRSKFKTSVGGQAVMEGVMMQGPAQWCLSVRKPDGEIVSEVHQTSKRWWAKIPFVRGVCSFITSLFMGYQTLMRSAELAMDEDYEEEELSKFDIWVDKHFGEVGTKIIMGISVVLGLALALGLFIVAPTAIVGFLGRFVPVDGIRSLLEGILKMVIFICYLFLVRRMKDIRRVFKYHGAEHKTISCYESGDALTVENIRPHSRFHPRCGTSFIFIVLMISIIVNAFIPSDGTLLRIGFKFLLLPVVMAISYELLRLAGRYDNILTRILSAPGLWVQRLTTDEPDDSMIEVAIEAVTPVLPEVPEEAKW